jgi:hypothetical protein
LLRRLKSQKIASVRQVLFSPNGKLLAAEGLQGPPVLFDAGNGKELDSFGKEFDLVENSWEGDSPIAFSPDGKTLGTIGGREALHFWDLGTGKDRLATPEAYLGGIYALARPALLLSRQQPNRPTAANDIHAWLAGSAVKRGGDVIEELEPACVPGPSGDEAVP